MNAVLTSINKPHTDRIFSDVESEKKTVEWRTKPLPEGLHYVYETKNKGGCGKVIGEMTIVGWRKFGSVSDIPLETILKGRVGARQLAVYAKNKPLYANVIVNAKLYEKPKELGEFYHPVKYDKDGNPICGTAKEIADLYEWDCESVFGVETNGNGCLGNNCPRLKEFCRVKRPPQSWCRVDKKL